MATTNIHVKGVIIFNDAMQWVLLQWSQVDWDLLSSTKVLHCGLGIQIQGQIPGKQRERNFLFLQDVLAM